MPIRIESRFLSLLAHDLRNPLNVIGLSLRMIEEELPEGNREVREDLDILRQNVAQLARMLSFLSDFARQVDEHPALEPQPFDPRRLVAEVAEEAAGQLGSTVIPIRVQVCEGCPTEVTLDPGRARLGLRYALTNAVASACGSPIGVVARGKGDRLEIEIGIERPPRSTVRSTHLRGDLFERVLGNETERLGMDMAIAARVSELLGGSARLQTEEGRSSAIVLDWPQVQKRA